MWKTPVEKTIEYLRYLLNNEKEKKNLQASKFLSTNAFHCRLDNSVTLVTWYQSICNIKKKILFPGNNKSSEIPSVKWVV